MLNKYTNFLRNYPIDLFLLVDIITTNIAEKYQKKSTLCQNDTVYKENLLLNSIRYLNNIKKNILIILSDIEILKPVDHPHYSNEYHKFILFHDINKVSHNLQVILNHTNAYRFVYINIVIAKFSNLKNCYKNYFKISLKLIFYHRKSLSNNDMTLHGITYSNVLMEQTRILLVLCLSKQFKKQLDINDVKEKNFTHNNSFHILLGIPHIITNYPALLGIKSSQNHEAKLKV